MILGGRAFAIEMGQASAVIGPLIPNSNDSKGNVYHLFVSGFVDGVILHQLIIDKIHSDYGGVPMVLAPGSRLESGIQPIADSTEANRTCAALANALYLFPEHGLDERATLETFRKTGTLSHIEINVSDLKKSAAFWGTLLSILGYMPYQSWDQGVSFIKNDLYIVFVQTLPQYLNIPFHRRRTGLNHLAFFVDGPRIVDEITRWLRAQGVSILYEDRHPYAAGTDKYAVFFEDPDRIKVEVVCVDPNYG